MTAAELLRSVAREYDAKAASAEERGPLQPEAQLEALVWAAVSISLSEVARAIEGREHELEREAA